MSQWNDTPYSWAPGANRLIAPVNLASSTDYVFNAKNSLVQDAISPSKDVTYYQDKVNNPVPTSPAPVQMRILIRRK